MEFINEKYGHGFTLKMIENGVFADYCGNKESTIKLMPPLVTTFDEVDLIMNRLGKAFASLPRPK
jgi:4-aminobutyrate aminotransferase-like enzyme